MPEEQNKSAAPYLPFKTFLGSLETFTQGIPPRIDRTIWRQSGLIQGLIMGSYRFFRLIDDNERPTEMLQSLVRRKDERADLIGSLLNASYPEIMGDHDLTTMTMAMLDELIEKYNVSGSTKKKAITFFLQASKFAGVKLSSFIQVRSTGGTRKKRAMQARNNGDSGQNDDYTPAPQSGSDKVIMLKSGGQLSLRVSVDFLSLSADDRTFVFELVDKMNGYEKKSVTSTSK